jgi:hypothetical protein
MGAETHREEREFYETPLLVDVEEACGLSILCATSGTSAADGGSSGAD